MAYMSQEKKKLIKVALDALKLPKTWKLSLSVDNHSTLVCTIVQAPATAFDDFRAHIDDYGQIRENFAKSFETFQSSGYFTVNEFHMQTQFTGKTLSILEKIMGTIKSAGEWFDKSDSQSDYFHIAYHIDLQFGRWNKPCVFVGTRRTKSEAVAEVAEQMGIPVIDIPLSAPTRVENGSTYAGGAISPVLVALDGESIAIAEQAIRGLGIGTFLHEDSIAEIARAVVVALGKDS